MESSGPTPGAGPIRHALLESRWERAADFAERYTRAERTFFHPVAPDQPLPAEAQVGEVLCVVLVFVERRAEIRLHARVVERRDGGPERGLLLAFLPEEKRRIELVNACAEGESIPYARRAFPRVPCQIPAHVEAHTGLTFDCLATNLSERGAFLATSERLKAHAPVRLTLTPRPDTSLRLRARVTSAVGELERGLGIEFVFRSAEERQLIAAEVARLRAAPVHGQSHHR